MRRALLLLVLISPGCRPPPGILPARDPDRVLPLAPHGPGEVPRWTPGNKTAVGTAAGTASRVWFTLQGGRLTEIYHPSVDAPAARGLELLVSDGTSVWTESSDLVHEVRQLDEGALLFQQISRHPAGRFTLTKTVITDPERDTLLLEVQLAPARGLALYLLYRPALGATGTGDTGFSAEEALLAEEGRHASALVARPPLTRLSSGFAGVNDLTTQLRRGDPLTRYRRAERGNLIQSARLRTDGGPLTIALGFGESPRVALARARGSLGRGFADRRASYVAGWREYLQHLRPVVDTYRREVHLAAMVLHAHEDKTRRGGMVASLSIPWGTIRSAARPTGGYHLVWPRDLYHVGTALLALGDRAAAERALDYLFTVQQRTDGSFPQNTWLDGRPYWPSLQLDEVALPLILAWQLERRDHATWQRHIRPAADFLLAHGPRTPQDRWEEEAGYSPATIAAETAALVCAADIARANGDAARAARYEETADSWAANVERWTVTTTGPLDAALPTRGYYLRINDDTDPDDGAPLELNNGGGTHDERAIVDLGFLELVRLGIRSPDDPHIRRSLLVADRVLRVSTPAGPAWYRYNHDGYGEKASGAPYDGTGVGRLWPIFTGERGEYEVARGGDARPLLAALLGFAGAAGMIPEQVWDRAPLPGHPFRLGHGTGSATPLAWSMAQLIRLVRCLEEGRIVEQPAVVARRYLRRGHLHQRQETASPTSSSRRRR